MILHIHLNTKQGQEKLCFIWKRPVFTCGSLPINTVRSDFTFIWNTLSCSTEVSKVYVQCSCSIKLALPQQMQPIKMDFQNITSDYLSDQLIEIYQLNVNQTGYSDMSTNSSLILVWLGCFTTWLTLLRSCQTHQFTYLHFSWAGLVLKPVNQYSCTYFCQ